MLYFQIGKLKLCATKKLVDSGTCIALPIGTYTFFVIVSNMDQQFGNLSKAFPDFINQFIKYRLFME